MEAVHDHDSGHPLRLRKQDLASEDVDIDDPEESSVPPTRTNKSVLQLGDEPEDMLDGTVPVDKITDQTFPAMADLQAAAAKRANVRREMNSEPAAEKEGTRPRLDGEEGNPPEPYNEVGMPMEPFNLDQEREDGFFTADGGYVERNQADSRDAWIQSLEDQGEVQGADSSAQELSNKPPANLPEVAEPPALSGAEISRERDILIAALRPSETVTEGLKRLSASDKRLFERATEAAEALVDAGETGLYDLARETLQRQQDQAPPPASRPAADHPSKRPRVGQASHHNGPAAPSTSQRDPEAKWGTSAWGATAAELNFGSNPGPHDKLDADLAQPVDVTDSAADREAAAAATSHAPDHLVGIDLDRVSASYAHPAAVPGGKLSDAAEQTSRPLDQRSSEDMSVVSSAPAPKAPPPESSILPTMAELHGNEAASKQQANGRAEHANGSIDSSRKPKQKHIEIPDDVGLLAAARRPKPAA